MADPSALVEFEYSLDDPLATEHVAVWTYVQGRWCSIKIGRQTYGVTSGGGLKSLGEDLLAASLEQCRRYARAAIEQLRHWERLLPDAHAEAVSQGQLYNPLANTAWNHLRGIRRLTTELLGLLIRRRLPFEQSDILALLAWCNECDQVTAYSMPVGHIARTLERFAGAGELGDEVKAALKEFARRLRSSHDKNAKRYGTAVEQLVAAAPSDDPEEDEPRERLPPPSPAPAGTPTILVGVKTKLGMAVPPEALTTPIGPDEFPLRADSPLIREHELLTEFFEQAAEIPQNYNPDLTDYPAGRALLGLAPDEMGRAILAAAERYAHGQFSPPTDWQNQRRWQAAYASSAAVVELEARECVLSRDQCFDVLLFNAVFNAWSQTRVNDATARHVAQAAREAETAPLTEGERFILSLLRTAFVAGPCLGASSDEVAMLTRLIGDGAQFFLAPGEVWTEALNNDLSRLPRAERDAWAALLRHAMTATSARPSAKWLKTADKLVVTLGIEQVRAALNRWLPLVARGDSPSKVGCLAGVMHDENGNALKGLLWIVPRLAPDEPLTRAVTSVALSAYKKVPGVGPRAVRVGNGAVYALSELGSTDAVGQLALLKVRVKFGSAQKEIEKAFNAAAAALGLPRDQIEEMGVPSYGLDADGVRRETLGDYRAELTVTGSDAAIQWFDAKDKPLKSVPAKVRSEHKDDLKELQQALKDVQGMLPAQRDRIDGMFLLQKSWPIDAWRERYFNHPLIGSIARRLLWCVDGAPALFLDGAPRDVAGAEIAHGKTAEITLWHPVGRTIDEIVAWRCQLEELRITQPFKQAHREVYLLTDAERNTNTYSNRYAAHIIRQHQFNALCGARGWRNKLRLMVDDTYPPATKDLSQWGLRAEFWIEGIGDGYGVDTNEAGTYHRLATDQVRFYRTDAAQNVAQAGTGQYTTYAAGPGAENINEPLPLDQIPPLVFSEIMRDVDLFVGVASVGNDPNWQDGGPEGRYRDYWHNYAFGELSNTAATRREVLERLIPRLKIANRCALSDRFLAVRGSLRTYKIHLGSGNILMEPNDQYLCIVPDSRARVGEKDLFLPFEGDGILSIVISKALLLADDAKIKDPTITRQIKP